MSNLHLTRKQLEDALGTNHDTIVQFEKLIQQVSVLTPTEIDLLLQLLNRIPPGSDTSSIAQDGDPGIPGVNGINGRDGVGIPGAPGQDGQDGVPMGGVGSSICFGPAAVATITVRNGIIVDIA